MFKHYSFYGFTINLDNIIQGQVITYQYYLCSFLQTYFRVKNFILRKLWRFMFVKRLFLIIGTWTWCFFLLAKHSIIHCLWCYTKLYFVTLLFLLLIFKSYLSKWVVLTWAWSFTLDIRTLWLWESIPKMLLIVSYPHSGFLYLKL